VVIRDRLPLIILFLRAAEAADKLHLVVVVVREVCAAQLRPQAVAVLWNPH
jgi:hypothetical protein